MCTSLQSNRGNKRDKDNKGVVGATRAVLVRRSALLRPFRSRNRHGLCGPRGHTMNDRLMGASENATEMRKRRSEKNTNATTRLGHNTSNEQIIFHFFIARVGI